MDKQHQELQWQDIAARDPFLAGSIAGRSWLSWMEETAESQASSVGLVGTPREKFIAGWNYELAQQERKEQAFQEWDEIGKLGFEKGDPAAW